MSCMRLSSVLQVSSQRSLTLRTLTITSQSAKDHKDDEKGKTKSVSELMSALKGLKVDGIRAGSKPKIGFSAAAEFKKRKLQKIQNVKKSTAEKQDSVSKSGLAEVEDKVKEAAADVAKTFPDQKKTESELLQQLMRVKDATMAGASGQEVKDVSAILSGIRVQKEGPQGEGKRNVAFDSVFSDVAGGPTSGDSKMDRDDHPYQRKSTRTLFDRQRLNIFHPEKMTDKEDAVADVGESSIWELEAEKEKKLVVSDSIRNGFDEMIQLTEEGKLWTYPIDNERGLEEEQKVPFYEHVFLEQHLEGFPNIPEVLNFMELVLIGLGKNPYLTVEQKQEHIEWFKSYFENKSDVLKESSISS